MLKASLPGHGLCIRLSSAYTIFSKLRIGNHPDQIPCSVKFVCKRSMHTNPQEIFMWKILMRIRLIHIGYHIRD